MKRFLLFALLLLPGAVFAQPDGTFNTTLSWTAPTQNTDGSELDDLAGYVIFWGTESGNYSDSMDIGMPAMDQFVMSDETLDWGTEYFFVIRAYNEDGVRSSLSNETSVVTPTVPEAPGGFSITVEFQPVN